MNKSELEIDRVIKLELEGVEKDYNSELSKLNDKYENKRRVLLGENELINFIKSLKSEDIIPATYSFSRWFLQKERIYEYGKIKIGGSLYDERELNPQMCSSTIKIILKLMEFDNKYGFNVITFAKDNIIFKVKILKHTSSDASETMCVIINSFETDIIIDNSLNR